MGDDWQSIFRFAGSDIHLMRHFTEEFGGNFNGETGIHRVVDLGRTFGSVNQIAFAARTFVLRNPAQLQKQIVPAGSATEPAIRLLSTDKGEEDKTFIETLAAFSAALGDETRKASVLLLGRYRHHRILPSDRPHPLARPDAGKLSASVLLSVDC